MAVLSDVLAALAYAGIGGAVGSVGAALVTARSGKGEARAHAADLVASAAGNLATTQAATIARLDTENEDMRKSIVALTRCIDELLDELDLPLAAKRKLRKANLDAKQAL